MQTATIDPTTDTAPELTLAIGGEQYGFSELDETRLDALLAWLKAKTPHPLDQLKGDHLAHLSDKEREKLFNRAMEQAASYPPRLDTFDQQLGIVTTRANILEFLKAALSVHHPGLTPADVRRVYRQIENEGIAAEKAAKEAAKVAKEAGEESTGGESIPTETPLFYIFQTCFGRRHLINPGA